MGILDFFNQQAWNEQQANSPYTPEMRMNAGMQQLGLLGGSLMAAGAPTTNPGQFGQMMGQYAAQSGPQMQQSLDSQFQMSEWQKEQDRLKKMQDFIAGGGGGLLSPEQLEFIQNAPPEVGMGLLGEQLFAQGGDDPLVEVIDPNTGLPTYVPQSQAAGMQADYGPTQNTSDAAQLWADEQAGRVPAGTFQAKYGDKPAAPPAANYTNFANREGQIQSVDLSTPEGRATAQALTQQGFFEVGTNVNASNLGSIAGADVQQGPVDMAGKPIAPAKDHEWFKDDSGNWAQRVIPGTPSAVEAAAAEGAAAESNQAAIADADQMIDLLDQAIKHPGMSGVVGLPNISGGLFGGYTIPGTDEASFKVLMEQIGGNVFLDAYKSLKGSGQITEVEGAKAEAAIARLGTAQKEEDFIAALTELRNIVQVGKDRLTGESSQVTGDSPPLAPADPAKREVGKIYVSPNGTTGKWTGDGWELQ